MPVKIIEVDHLHFSYNSIPVLEDVSFCVEAGSFVGLVGPNGSGKTTLVKLILGLATCGRGVIRLFGQDISDFRLWAKVGYLPQSLSALNPYFPSTVREIVALGLLSGKRFPRIIARSDKRVIDGVLDLLGIASIGDTRVGELSGGQQQRVLIARAMVNLKDLQETRDTSIILVTHDIGNIGKYADHLLWIDRKLLFYGGFDEFCQSDRMTRLFGAESQHIICHRH
jgi:zinc transport system ATP-binding protein